MIYTVTTNPNIDYYAWTEGMPLLGTVNRTLGEQISPGGKGVNVSLVLNRLGVENCALGFVAGHVGDMFCGLLQETGCRSDFIRLPKGETRINVKLEGDCETAFNGAGPALHPTHVAQLLQRLAALEEGDTVVLSGNLQSSISGAYAEILERMAPHRVRAVVDTTGAALRGTFRYRPFLAKPNAEELAELFGEAEPDLNGAIAMAKRVQAEGPQNVLVSMGSQGAVLIADDGQVYRGTVQGPCRVVSTVGAGDSLTAGYLAGYLTSSNHAAALCLGIAAGTATACSELLATTRAIQDMLPHVSVERI